MSSQPAAKRAEEDPEANSETKSEENTTSGSDSNEEEKPQQDKNVVDWDGPDDPENPMNWSNGRKWFIVSLVAITTFNISMASTILAPGVPEVMAHFHNDSIILSSFIVSVYIIGFAFGPLLVAPLSELYGRSIVTHVTNTLFLIFTVACGVSTDLNMFIVFRLFQGLMACTPLTLGGGFIADLMTQDKRPRALSIWTFGPLMGPVLGPVLGGFIAQGAGWRWVFWLVVIISGVLTITSFIVLRETYGPELLKRKALKLRKETGNPDLHSKFDDGTRTPYQVFTRSIVRPTKMLFLAPIVTILAVYIAIVYGTMYLLFTTITYIFERDYGFTEGTVGLAYLGVGVGFILGLIATGMYSDIVVKKKRAKYGAKPEDHLPPLLVGCILLPIGLIIYGWSAQYKVQWIVPIIGTALFGFGNLCAFLPVQLYLVDAYTIYAASAIATNTVLRSVFGAVLPLASQKMYDALGLGWGNTLLALVSILFVPVPIILLKHGEKIRTKFAIEL